MFINEYQMFFCNYKDSYSVKKQKLKILSTMTNENNINEILSEIHQYTYEIDVNFVKDCINFFGQLAIKNEKFSNQSINLLMECIKNKSNYLIQESIIVIKDIFRIYQSKYLRILDSLFENLIVIDYPKSKAAFIWIISKYIDIIGNGEQFLQQYLLNFQEEDYEV